MKKQNFNPFYYALVLFLGFGISVFASPVPTNNPYKTMYGTNGTHWTDSIAWSSIFNVVTYGAVADDAMDDQASVEAAIDAANLAGGGVVFFPAGVYKFSNTLKLKSGVVLRGADFANNVAKNDPFQPVSILEFPKYNPVLTGTGTPITEGFKAITSFSKSINNIGIVNLDVNRARIEFHPSFVQVGSNSGNGGDPNFQPVEHNRNCIVMGVRSNNTAVPDPGIPTVANQNLWQRFSWRFAANFDLYFAQNVIVANCKLNDLSQKRMDDSYDQPGYRTNPAVAIAVPTDSLTRFNYAAHYGISVNRAKIMGALEDKTITIKPFVWYAQPEEEPGLFAKGVEIVDNWVYKELRIAITASGLGLLIKGNVTKDKANKIAYLGPDGKSKNTNYSATYENRGIDFSGWDVRVEDNDVEAFPLGWPGTNYKSIDGEGIMNQGNSGGSSVNGLVLMNNTVNTISSQATNPAYSCYSMEEVFNVVCKHNNVTGINGYYLFSATKVAQLINNVVVDSNYVGRIDVVGASGGSNNYVRYNTRMTGANYGQVNTGIINSSCNVTVSDNISLTQAACTGNPPSLPKAIIVTPAADLAVSTNTYAVTVATGIGLVADSVVFYNGTKRYKAIMPTDSLVQQSISLMKNVNFISAKVYKGGLFNYSPIRRIDYKEGSNGTVNPSGLAPITIYPNPAESFILINSNTIPTDINIYDICGQLVKNTKNTKTVDIASMKSGIYLVSVKLDGSNVSTIKFLKK